MNPKRIGFLGFEGVAASELTRAADVLAAATLDGGYGNRISCYQISTIGFTSECFRAESGIAFWPDSTLETASELDTIVIPGGDGLRLSLVSETIAEWVLVRVNETRRVVAIGGGIYGVAPTGLLDGREVTTHWRYAGDVARSFLNLRVNPRRHLVKDGAFYTSSGPQRSYRSFACSHRRGLWPPYSIGGRPGVCKRADERQRPAQTAQPARV
jgi:transcriptional regulator GlxA family with amidase domain